jgi:uncharacterized protein YecT (DUF1311 family)
MRKYGLLCGLVLATGPALSQDKCDRNDDSQQMMNLCAGLDYQAADKRLNATYAGIVGDLRGDGKTLGLLRKTQRAWIAFRDAECAYAAADSEGGSIYPMLVSMCLTKVTNERIRQLEADGNCEGGDAGC